MRFLLSAANMMPLKSADKLPNLSSHAHSVYQSHDCVCASVKPLKCTKVDILFWYFFSNSTSCSQGKVVHDYKATIVRKCCCFCKLLLICHHPFIPTCLMQSAQHAASIFFRFTIAFLFSDNVRGRQRRRER